MTDPAATNRPASPRAASPDGRRARKKAENRARILAAGLKVFTDIGYESATVRDVIRLTGLASGTFYNYFPDKEAVLLALLNESLARVNARVRAARRAATDLEGFVRGAYEAVFRLMANEPAAIRVLHRNAGAVRHVVGDSLYAASVRELREDIADGIARGALPPIDVDYLTAAIGAVSFEIAVVMAERDPPDLAGATEFATKLICGGIREASGTGK